MDRHPSTLAFPPPAEDKVKAIAKIIECDPDDLLARAGRVSTDISDIIKRHPVELRHSCGPPRACPPRT